MKAELVALILTFASLCSTCVAQAEYVIANENNRFDNAIAVYQLDTQTGSLEEVAVLATGTRGLGPDGLQNLANSEQAISPGAACIFALDSTSENLQTDIASFSKGTGYAKVGNYSNPLLEEADAAGSLALTPNGQFLYATYSETNNIGAWAVDSDCSLSFIGAYPPGAAGAAALKVTPNGAYLVAAGGSAELFSIDPSAGTLTDIASFPSGDVCTQECPIRGLDFTGDSKLVIFAVNGGNGIYAVPAAFTATITPAGFGRVQTWDLNNTARLAFNNVPFLSAAAYVGSGNLYFAAYGGEDFPGVLTTNFTEQPPKITLANATVIDPTIYDGAIAVTGNLLVVAEYPSQIGVFEVNADGSLTEMSTTVVESQDPGMFSLSLFPSSR